MNWTREDLSGGRAKFVFSLDKKNLSRELDVVCKKEQKDIHLKGFRKGHTPLSMIKKIYGSSIQKPLIDRFLQNNFAGEIKKNDLWLVNIIDTNHSWDRCEDGVFYNISSTFLADIIPKLNIETKDLTFKRDKTEISSEDIEKTRTVFKEMKSFLKEKKEAVEKGDFVSVDLSFELENGEVPSSLKIEDDLIKQGQYPLEEINDALIDMKEGEGKMVKDIALNHSFFKKYEGKKAICHLKVHEVKIMQMPFFDEKLAEQYGFDDMESFENHIKNMAFENKRQQEEIRFRWEVIQTLRKKYSFEIPNSFLESSYPDLKNFKMEGDEKNDEEKKLQKQVMDKLSTDVILDQLGHKYGIDFGESYRAKGKEYQKKRLEFENKVFEKLYKDIKISESSSSLKSHVKDLI